MYSKKERLDRLIKIADFLDTHDREEDADFMEGLIRQEVGAPAEESQEIEIEIPEDELVQIREIHRLIGDSLPQEG
jgi:hypothetical protein